MRRRRTGSPPPPAHRPAVLLAVLGLAAAAFAVPAPAAAADKLDVVFVLDTTGSMSAEIREVQERVGELAESLAAARAGERIRFGVVAYRDRGDLYVTLISPLDPDLETTRRFLGSLEAGGGGDGPESVIAALAAALREIEWDLSDEVERQVFLVGDAPPHLDYGDEPAPEELIAEARRLRIAVNAIGCRSLPSDGVEFFRRFAYATEGSYQHIGRLEGAHAGDLTEAMTRAVSPAAAGDPGEEVALTWLGRDEGAGPAGILVRLGGGSGFAPAVPGQETVAAGCTLEVYLPAGTDLAAAPRARFGPRGLAVELELTAGAGGLDVFSPAVCPPQNAPIRVSLAAAPGGN